MLRVYHEEALVLIVPWQVVLHADYSVLGITAEERERQWGVVHVKQLLDCHEQREMFWSEFIERHRVVKLSFSSLLLIDELRLNLG